jgi:hypothetical protein
VVIVVAMFVLTAFNLTSASPTLKKITRGEGKHNPPRESLEFPFWLERIRESA